MYSITTVTFNPCIDKSTTVSELIPEKKLRCSAPLFQPGGGGINIARVLKRFNCSAIAIYPAGGYSGKFLSQLLSKEQIPVITIDTVGHTRENMIVVEESTGKQYRFGMPGSPLTIAEIEQCRKAIETSPSQYLVISGSFAPQQDNSIITHIAKTASIQKKKLIIDTSGDTLQQAISIGAYLIKPNLNELGALLNTNATPENAAALAKEIINKNKVDNVIVSLGKSGAILVTKNICRKYTPPQTKTVSTVGAGDSMVAGMLFKLTVGWSVLEACKFGVACGTAATLNQGTELCHPNDAESIYLQIIETEIY